MHGITFVVFVLGLGYMPLWVGEKASHSVSSWWHWCRTSSSITIFRGKLSLWKSIFQMVSTISASITFVQSGLHVNMLNKYVGCTYDFLCLLPLGCHFLFLFFIFFYLWCIRDIAVFTSLLKTSQNLEADLLPSAALMSLKRFLILTHHLVLLRYCLGTLCFLM